MRTGATGDAEKQPAGAALFQSVSMKKKCGLKLPESLIFKKQPEVQVFPLSPPMGNLMSF